VFLWIIAALCAFFVKGLCGFANTLVFTTILSFGNSNVSITPVELILGYPSNLILAWKERESIQWRMCLPLALLVIAGSIPGALFLKSADTGVIKIIFGVVIILLGAEMLLREVQKKKMRQSRIVMGVIGVLSGLLCGLYGVGALLGAYLNRASESSSSFKANICVVFLADNTFRIILYCLWGIMTPDIVKQALMLIPLMLMGLTAGMLSGKYLDEKIMKRIVIIMLIISGLALILNSV